MNNFKNQNPILFLTTIGVYIGLLMAGAAPVVIAQQAAMTRNFELSDEIEQNDDLDLSPENLLDLDDLVPGQPENTAEKAENPETIADQFNAEFIRPAVDLLLSGIKGSVSVRHEVPFGGTFHRLPAQNRIAFTGSIGTLPLWSKSRSFVNRQLLLVTRFPRASLPA